MEWLITENENQVYLPCRPGKVEKWKKTYKREGEVEREQQEKPKQKLQNTPDPDE